jgi:hypothetical protein
MNHGSIYNQGRRFFCSPVILDWFWGAFPASYYGGPLSAGVQQVWCEVAHSHPSGGEVKNK